MRCNMNNKYKYAITSATKDISWYDQINNDFDIADKYALIMIESGMLILSDGSEKFIFTVQMSVGHVKQDCN